MDLNDYKEDQEKKESGSPCYYGEAYFNVKRSNTPEYQLQIEELRNNLYGFAPKDIDANLIVGHWLAEFGVTGWDGVFIGDVKLDFSRQNARKVFLNPDYFLSLNLLLMQHAGDYSKYLYDEVNKDIKQVKKS